MLRSASPARLEGLQRHNHFAVVRKHAGLFLRIHQLPIRDNFKNAAARLDIFRGNAKFLLNLGRQTGGLGKVVSLLAVFDGYFHESSPKSASRDPYGPSLLLTDPPGIIKAVTPEKRPPARATSATTKARSESPLPAPHPPAEAPSASNPRSGIPRAP